jgi:chemotaxis signal transduction protein
MKLNVENSSHNDTLATRAVRVLTAGSRSFGIFADEIDTIVDWRSPTPLPNAPAGILGVVCVRGRMVTLIAAGALLEIEADGNKKIVALAGDEQIGLAVSEAGEAINVDVPKLDADGTNALTLGMIDAAGQSIPLLNSKQLFATAMRGRERRKRQF